MEEVGGGVRDVKMRWDVPAGLSSKDLFSPSAAPISTTTPLYVRDNGDASSATPFWQSFGKSFGNFSKMFVDRWLRGESDWDARFVPTGALSLLETLHRKRPGHRLIAADFDSLPNVRVPVRRCDWHIRRNCR